MKLFNLIALVIVVLMITTNVNAVEPKKLDSKASMKKSKDVVPEYPVEAAKNGIEGLVTLEATISENGDVTGVKIVPSSTPQPLLEKSAVNAVKQWKYEPFRNNAGKAIPVIFTVNVNYKLTDKKQADSPVPAEKIPYKIKNVAPVYPEDARKQQVQGAIILKITINENGDVTECIIDPESKPQPLLEQAAIDAVKQWKYQSYKREDGSTAPLTFKVTVNFALR